MCGLTMKILIIGIVVLGLAITGNNSYGMIYVYKTTLYSYCFYTESLRLTYIFIFFRFGFKVLWICIFAKRWIRSWPWDSRLRNSFGLWWNTNERIKVLQSNKNAHLRVYELCYWIRPQSAFKAVSKHGCYNSSWMLWRGEARIQTLFVFNRRM